MTAAGILPPRWILVGSFLYLAACAQKGNKRELFFYISLPSLLLFPLPLCPQPVSPTEGQTSSLPRTRPGTASWVSNRPDFPTGSGSSSSHSSTQIVLQLKALHREPGWAGRNCPSQQRSRWKEPDCTHPTPCTVIT